MKKNNEEYIIPEIDKEIGSSGITITHNRGEMVVRHLGEDDILHKRTLLKGEWNELWSWIKKPTHKVILLHPIYLRHIKDLENQIMRRTNEISNLELDIEGWNEEIEKLRNG